MWLPTSGEWPRKVARRHATGWQGTPNPRCLANESTAQATTTTTGCDALLTTNNSALARVLGVV
jgi:hypothetical protein